jgi:TetR/AcrR family transcriptional regulator, regulator of cefoperazone and chloramphenicol sensitivity
MRMESQSASANDLAGAEVTKRSLILAGLRLFGEKGYDATSTRELAAAANANIGSIAYHFGGKSGLHRACGEEVAAIMQRVAGPALAAAGNLSGLTPHAARSLFPMLLRRVAAFLLTGHQSDLVVPFILREMAHPGEAFEAIYTAMVEPVHTRLCAIWQAATGESAAAEATKLAVFAMMGQLIYFRIGASAVSRRLGRENYSAADVNAIVAVIERNIAARLGALPEDDKGEST